MSTTYDVRVYKTETYQGKKTITHYVRWKVAGKLHRELGLAQPARAAHRRRRPLRRQLNRQVA